jgi:hypothetical protein
MHGLGYRHPQWGMWKGELETGGESFDLQQLDPLAPEHFHVQQVVRARDGKRTAAACWGTFVSVPMNRPGSSASLTGQKA